MYEDFDLLYALAASCEGAVVARLYLMGTFLLSNIQQSSIGWRLQIPIEIIRRGSCSRRFLFAVFQ